MTVQEIISALSQYNGKFPEQALVAAREHWALLVPEINMAFERAVTKNELSEEEENFLFWSVLLIGDRKEKDCFESFMLFLDQDDADYSPLECVLGDSLTEDLPNIVAIVAEGRAEPLNKMLISMKAGEYVKVGMLRVLKHMLFNSEITTDYFANHAPLWIEVMVANQHSFALAVLGEILIDLKLSSFQSMYLGFAKKDSIDHGMLSNDQIKDWAFETECDCRRDHYGSFDIMSVKNWASMNGNNEWDSMFMFNPFEQFIEEPYMAPKIPRRNDPCLCGSGKKYKKCCLN
ncbi:SecC motif-containing protein [Vibrio ichthyoenteri ATCC 700023]|uniref:SecC motif-containing protein n=1 Tax=Vibrio ichthyoenteri ATCC 700023 TaxID=870968 RepID=F9S2Z1_9VIBR|nr:DUF1186 domain-containing protein [Vibrio ichthyoenteri]EGU38761.1 SecC motif-containing protein [Vibrio ichthyoenteri ATCC 700023]